MDAHAQGSPAHGSAAQASDPATLTWQSSDGLDLFARDYAPAEETGLCPVLCIPGLTRNSLDFADSAPWIAGLGRRVLAVDLRGRGRSQRTARTRSYRPAVYARDMVELLDRLEIERVHILGTSLGGIVALSMAGEHLPRLAGAVLNDIGPVPDRAGIARISSYAGSAPAVESWEDAARYAQHINGVSFPDYGPQDWARFASNMFREDADGRPQLDYDRAIFRPMPGWAMSLASLVMWRRFRRLASRRPVLVLRGELSDLLSARTVTRMHRAAPSLMSAQIPRVGHAPDLSEPAARAALETYFAAAD